MTNGKVRSEIVGRGSSAYEVLHPPNTLGEKVTAAKGTVEDAIARAERALEGLSHNFQDWMEGEVAQLIAARDKMRTDPGRDQSPALLHRVAHDIRGQGATFGLPLATLAADSLCRLIESVEPGRLPPMLIDQHVDAIRAIVAENARGDGSQTARTLVDRLSEVTQDYIRSAS